MKVLNLRCANDHRFEGWFASHEDFVSQGERGLLTCPLCGDHAIERLPSAPRLNVATPRGEAAPPPPPSSGKDGAPGVPSALEQAHGRWMRAVRHLIERTEDVGDRFPEEARKIHYGETAERSIRGRASAEDADALREEGIEVVAVPLPESLKGPLQ